MKFSRWTRRLLDSTRGQVILLLRREPRTVADLAGALDVTNNAVRAHLATLERDGLVCQRGERAGFRKPHRFYELTQEADELFPKAYGPVLDNLISVLKEDLGSEEAGRLLRKVGHRLVPAWTTNNEFTLEQGLDQALRSLGELGGQATLSHDQDGKVLISSSGGCPLSGATADHCELCGMVETFLSDIIGVPVQEVCQRNPSLQCCFEVQAATKS